MLLSNPIEAFHPLYTCYEKCKLGSSSSSSFDLLIRHYVRSRKGLDGVLVFRMMKEVSLVPQVRTLSALLHGLVHCRHYGLVMGVFEEMINVGVRPDLYIYSGVWNDFKILDRVSIGHGGRADELVFEAVVQIPDSPLFNQGVVLRKLNTTHAQRRGRRAIEVLKKLVRRRLLYHSYSMQVHGYISNSLRDDPYSFTLVHGCHGSFSIRHWLQQSDWLPTLEATLALDEESLKVEQTVGSKSWTLNMKGTNSVMMISIAAEGGLARNKQKSCVQRTKDEFMNNTKRWTRGRVKAAAGSRMDQYGSAVLINVPMTLSLISTWFLDVLLDYLQK
ncbi:hypothetical protein HID58_088476 [Brassica napus]|uniref:Pentatricopeptide repeat-containing protein n=1 Tax=Brassica napus TaxID=3708 RepID=A0ABQ7XW84_BRANA|nr:hypothetical protein HID58_088476 [Brassica napus]